MRIFYAGRFAAEPERPTNQYGDPLAPQLPASRTAALRRCAAHEPDSGGSGPDGELRHGDVARCRICGASYLTGRKAE